MKSQHIWAIVAIVGVTAVVIWLLTKGPTFYALPSGATASTPATLNPTVATTSYGK